MNFVFATDSHISSSWPASRTDNYLEAVLKKFQWVVDKANSLDAHLLLGGDIVDKYNASPSIMSELAVILNGAHRQIFGIVGNHDVYGHNYRVINKVILGLLFNTGIIKMLEMEPLLIEDAVENIVIQLTGASYVPDMESRKDLYNVKKSPEANYAIHLVHGFLIRKHWEQLARNYTLISELHTEADVTCAGHEHSGFGVESFDGRIFTNPGALGRNSASVSDIARTPGISIIEATKENIGVTVMPIGCARPSNEVLNRELLDEELSQKRKLVAIRDTIEETIEVNDVKDIFEFTAKDLKVSEAVYNCAKTAMTAFEEGNI